MCRRREPGMQEAQYDFLHGQTDRSDFFSPRNAAALWYYERQSGCFAKRYWRRIFPLYFTVPQYRDVHLRCNVLQGHSIAEQVYKDSFSVVFSLSDALEWKSSGRNQKRCWKREIAAYTVAVCLMRKISMRQGGDI